MNAAGAFWLLFATAAAVAPAQSAPESALPGATIHTRVNLIMVPVVVRDRGGKAVANLTQGDFQLFDRGKPQTISAFSMERGGELPPSGSTAPRNGQPKPPPADVATMPTRFVAYLFDDMHLAPGEFIPAREAARKHLSNSLGPGDRAGVFTTSGKVMLDFTHDRLLIDQTLLRILPQASAFSAHDCPPIDYHMADAIVNRGDSAALEIATADYRRCNPASNRFSAGLEVQASANRALSRGSMDTQITLSTLLNVIRRMSSSPGERLVVLISSGFYLQADFRRQESEMIDHAIRSRVIISTVDARGLFAWTPAGDPTGANRVNPRTAAQRTMLESEGSLSEGDTLGEFAEGTGGLWFHNNNDLVDGLNRVAAAPECYYVLGFSPADLKLDGSFHSLKVSVKTKNVTSQARNGYFASKGAPGKEDRAKVDIHEAFVSRGEVQEIPVTVRTDVVNLQVSVTARIGLKSLPFRKSEARNLDTLTVVTGLFDQDGKLAVDGVLKTINLAFKDETLASGKADSMETKLTFDAPPGKYMLRLVVRDSEGEMIGARNSVVEIP